MTIENVQRHLAQRPFVPFRIIMSSGETYDVRHPENCIPIRGGLAVVYGGGNGELPEGVATLSILHVTAIEPRPFEYPGPKSRKGRPRR